MSKSVSFSLLGILALLTACADKPPMYGHAETYDRTHLQFGNADLEESVRIEPITASRDPAGLLHVNINIRNVTDRDLYVDCFVTFLRNGQPVDKEGPKTVTLKENLFDTISMNSTEPATDYFVSLDYAK